MYCKSLRPFHGQLGGGDSECHEWDLVVDPDSIVGGSPLSLPLSDNTLFYSGGRRHISSHLLELVEGARLCSDENMAVASISFVVGARGCVGL